MRSVSYPHDYQAIKHQPKIAWLVAQLVHGLTPTTLWVPPNTHGKIGPVKIHPKSYYTPNPKPLIEFVTEIFRKRQKNLAGVGFDAYIRPRSGFLSQIRQQKLVRRRFTIDQVGSTRILK